MGWKDAATFDDAHGDVDACCLAFSPHGEWLASGGCDGTMNLWDLATSRKLLRTTGTRIVTSVCFSPDGKHLAWCSAGEAVMISDLQGDVKVLKLNEKLSTESVAFSPDGKYVAAGGGALGKLAGQVNETVVHGHLNIWETTTGRELLAETLDRMPVRTICFSPDATWLAVVSTRGGTRWDLASGTSQKLFVFQRRQSIRSLAFRADGTPLVVGVEGESIKVWNLVNGHEVCEPASLAPFLSFLNFGPNGEVLGCNGTTVKVWDGSTGREVHSLETDGDVCSMALSHHDGARLATGYSYGKVQVWMLTD
jgi:WD40 repeat protein